MVKNKSIKVIKRGERKAQDAPVEQPADAKTSTQAARDMVATVTNWVQEFQQKRRTETSQALKTLFPDTAPQTFKA